MKLKKAVALLLAICICVLFCGCDLFGNGDDLVSPPELTGDMSPIADALYASAGKNLNLEYPAVGDHRSAIVLEDINSDGKFEAFAFYSTSEDEMTTMHINVICQNDGEWKSLSDHTMVANGVERVDFCDINSDGKKEIFVGWDVNGVSEKQLTVFDFNQDFLTQLLQQPYTSFLCNDLDGDGTNELFIHCLNTADKSNRATVYNYRETGMVQTAGCIMDAGVKSASEPILSTLTNGKTAIYIDEIKGVGAVTEALYLANGELKNPLLENKNTFENTLTLRAASLVTQDIDGDGTLEIPVASDLPNASVDGEKLYYTNWCAFDGQSLLAKRITVVNTVDGYYLTVPDSMIGNIAVLKNIEKHKREIYSYDKKTETTGELLFEVTAVSVSKWDSKEYSRGSAVEVTRKDDTVFTVSVSSAAEEAGVSVDVVKDTFTLIN